MDDTDFYRIQDYLIRQKKIRLDTEREQLMMKYSLDVNSYSNYLIDKCVRDKEIEFGDNLKKLYDLIELKKCDENKSLSMSKQFEKMKNLGVI